MRRFGTILVIVAALAASVRPASAQGTPLDKLTIHGYLSQAYARSDSLRVLGITRDGTTDYRRAALLFRYAMSDRESFVVQLAHRRLGDSPTMQVEDNVKLDWGFYQRKLASETMLRVGKAPIPMGVYNETRYVGTTMPFYRAPVAFYSEGSFTSETIEGVVLSQGIFTESAWRLDVSAYGGTFGMVDAIVVPTPAGPQYAVGEAEAKNVLGGQAWLATPIPGIRIGGGGSRFTSTGGVLLADGSKVSGTSVHASVDANLDRYALRAEGMQVGAGTLRYRGGYVQGSLRFARAFSIHGLAQFSEVRVREIPFLGTLEMDGQRTLGVGLNYQPASHLVWKNEMHWTRGYGYEDVTINPLGPGVKGSHVISSLSVTF